jgi:pentatricopeptide repeat protein
MAALEQGKQIHRYISNTFKNNSIELSNSLLTMYGKCGSLSEAAAIFNNMDQRDVVTYTAMMAAYGQHGQGHQALNLFKEMKEEKGFSPDEVTFTALLNACSHSGLIKEGLDCFASIEHEHITPTLQHYACVVDLLGRAGKLEEAEQFVNRMPFPPDYVTWMTLLGACRCYDDVTRGERIAQRIIEADPQNATARVVLSNIYAASGQWDKQEALWAEMNAKRIKKIPGQSCVEVNGKVSIWVANDHSHPQYPQMKEKYRQWLEEMKIIGYVPDTSVVVRKMAEEEKEQHLCSHSEKLALTYACINTPPRTTVRITKNLRVCPDCHTATKIISAIEQREIIVRDANRFHHFKDGKCSCNDYW